jgi:hypothetical protein
MRRALRHTDWGVLLIIAFSVIAAWSFIVQSELPNASQLEHYVFRTADYAQTLREGVLYPRWSAHVLSGYGAPIPHFYPPFPAYLPAAITVFLTNDPITAMRTVFVITYLLAGAATYTLVARRTEASYGLTAATLYLFSPFVGSTAPMIMGDVPQVLFHALLPILLWGVDGILLLNRTRDRLITALTVAGLVLTDPRFAVCGIFLAFILILGHVVSTRQARHTLLVLLSTAIGIGIAACYWLPVLAEWDQVTWQNSSSQVSPVLDINGVTSAYLPLDPNETAPDPQFTFGIVLVVFSTTSISYLLFRRSKHGWRSFQSLWIVIGGGTSIITLALVPTQTWLMGVMTFCFAIVGSMALNWRIALPKTFQNVTLPIALISIFAGTTSVWLVPQWRIAGSDFSPAAQIEYEQQGYGIAVLPDDASIPVPNYMSVVPQPNPALINGYRTNEINRVIPQAGRRVQIGTIANNNQSYNLQIRALDPLNLEVMTTYYEGWIATSPSLSVELMPNMESGLITIDIKTAGAGEIRLQFDTTPIRTLAWVVSGLSLGTLLLLAYVRDKTSTKSDLQDNFPLLKPAEVRLITMLLLGFVLVVTLVATPFSPLRISARPGYKLDNAFALRARTDVGIESLAYHIPRADYQAGEVVEFTVYWRTLRFLEQNYQVRASLISRATGARWQSTSLRNLGDYPTRRWITSLYLADEYSISLSPTTPTGEYSLSLEIYDCAVNCNLNNRLSFFDTLGQALGSQLILPVVLTITS